MTRAMPLNDTWQCQTDFVPRNSRALTVMPALLQRIEKLWSLAPDGIPCWQARCQLVRLGRFQSINLFFHVIALHAVADLRGRQTAGKAAPHSYTGARRHPTQNVRNLIDPAGAVINLFP